MGDLVAQPAGHSGNVRTGGNAPVEFFFQALDLCVAHAVLIGTVEIMVRAVVMDGIAAEVAVFIHIPWNSIPPQRPNRLSIYLGKITRNLALNRYKRYTAEKRGHGQVVLALSELEACVPSGMTVEQAVEENELAASIDRFLYSKPKLNRNIFVCRYYHLYAIRDIADAYGMSESKVMSLLFRMRNELRRFFEKEEIML